MSTTLTSFYFRCPTNGVANVSSCVFNSTAAISLPHFLYADPKYSQDVIGMKPNEKEHGIYIDISSVGAWEIMII